MRSQSGKQLNHGQKGDLSGKLNEHGIFRLPAVYRVLSEVLWQQRIMRVVGPLHFLFIMRI